MGPYGDQVNDFEDVLGQFNNALEMTHLLVCNEVR